MPVPSAKLTAAAAHKEAARKLIVRLVFVIYWLVIFEGALRKWVTPQFSSLLFFIKDPFVIAVYAIALKEQMWPKTILMKAALYLFVAFSALMFFQVIGSELNFLTGIYGLRMYFFYVPLAFIIGDQFRGKDLAGIVKQTLLLSIPMAYLCHLQYKSPPEAWINKTYMEVERMAMILGDLVRPSLTFTDGRFPPYFLGGAFAMLLSVWMLPNKQRLLNFPLLCLSTAGVIGMIAMNGNRRTLFFAVFSLVFTLISCAFLPSNKLRIRALVGFVLAIVAGGVLSVTVFQSAWQNMEERQARTEESEGNTVVRASRDLTTITKALDTPALGRGIGLGSGGGGALAAGYADKERAWTLAEDEWTRNLQEAGMLGIFYILFRIWLTIAILRGAVLCVIRAGNPFPLIFCGVSLPLLLTGVITMVGTINYFGWLFVGFNLAANNIGKSKEQKG